ncbi:hypothetical protein MM236_14030 [Belliella sp. DSM 107340]|uniref:DUF4221 domain-containing protein n=1 Tax=Belliella calami TaxID=2923436 RepID=A0ABS9UR76_9BACT|nr:hypothetical protein [Belliella calami]MCH7399119.1 hypothetical protein [Belliella calami]
MKNLYYLVVLLIAPLFIACSGSEQQTESNPSDLVVLELIDSLIVDELSPLTLQDVNLESGKALLVAKSKNVFLTDLMGEVLKEYSLSNDGPDGVGGNGAFGYKFLGEDKFVAQGFFTSYFVYDFEGKQVKKVPYNTDQLYRMMLYRNRTTFHPYMDGDQMMMIGEEHNFFSDEEMDPTVLGTKFYEKISSTYRYNLETQENEILESFPPTWEPRVNNRYVGSKTSFLALHDSKKSFALLPLQGSQVFFYDLGKEVTFKGEVQLQHPKRPELAPTISPDTNADYSDFPSFSNVLYAGDYCLIQFFSTIPEAKVSELKALSEQYFTTPEYKEASKQYVKPYFILVKNGKQIGIINELPVNGTVEFLDKNGVIYINDNISPQVERDYNLFYKVKIKE